MTAEDKAKAQRELLLKVYDAALGEYRFNVQLVWDRTKFFLVLSAGLIGAGVGLIKVTESSALESLFLAFFFLFSITITNCGLETLALGKRYYREAIFTKTLAERELGLLEQLPGLKDPRANLSIAVTDGQRNHRAILAGEGPNTASQISSGSVVHSVRTIFLMVIFIEVLGLIIAGFNAAIAAMKLSGP